MVVTVEVLRRLLNFESNFLNTLLTYHAVFLISDHLLMCSSGKFRRGRQYDEECLEEFSKTRRIYIYAIAQKDDDVKDDDGGFYIYVLFLNLVWILHRS